MGIVNIKGLDKAEVLLALWEGSQIQGISFLGLYNKTMSLDEAKKEVEEKIEIEEKEGREGNLYFDYVNGKVIKCDISKDEFDPWLYDRDNGEGAAEKAIERLLGREA